MYASVTDSNILRTMHSDSTFQPIVKRRKTWACQNEYGTFVMRKTSHIGKVSSKMLRTGTRNTDVNLFSLIIEQPVQGP